MNTMLQHLWEKRAEIRNIGIGGMVTSNQAQELLVTHALGSCIGLTLYDPVSLVGGMIHCKMPDSSMDTQRDERNPAVYVNEGVPLLLDTVLRLGARKNRLVVKLAGASVVESGNDLFRIGERNYAMMKQVLATLNLRIKAEECGGNKPRTLYLFMKDGRVVIRSQGVVREL